MDAVVIAGGRLKGRFAAVVGQQIKALLVLNGCSLLERTVTALARSTGVDRIVVVGPHEVWERAEGAGAFLCLPEAKTAIDNLLTGLEALEAKGQVLIATSDLAMIQSEDLDDLIARVPKTAGISYAISSAIEYETVFPSRLEARYVPLRDGRFTGGSVFIARAEVLFQLEPLLQGLFHDRKNPIALARRLGVGFSARILLSYLFGGWLAPTTEQLRKHAEKLLDCETVLVRGASPRLVLDVDTLEDWEFVKSYVEGLEQG